MLIDDAFFRRRITPEGMLVLKNMEEKDGGVYGCLASNQAGTDTMTSILTYIGECYRTHSSLGELWGGAEPS